MAVSECELSELIEHNVKAAEGIVPVFRDRTEAGLRLAREVSWRDYPNPVLFAIACGGIPVAFPIAQCWEVPLYLLLVAKIPFSATDHRFGIGAVTAFGTTVFNDDLLQMLGLTVQDISRGTQRAQEVIKKKMADLAHLAAPFPSDLRGKTAIVVDDGVASGMTASAAVADLRRLSPDRIVVAAAVCSQQGRRALEAEGTELVAGYDAAAPEFLLDNFFHLLRSAYLRRREAVD